MSKEMAKLPCVALACMILLLIVNQASSSRTLGNSTPTPTHHHHNHNHNHHKITFLMRDIFNVSTTKLTSITATTNDLPFSKPLGLIPPKGGVRVPLPATTGSSSPTLNFPGLFFPMARATLEELEFGTVTPIEEGIYHSHSVHNNGPRVVIGKAQGIYVASSEEGSSHMMAITASFGDEANGLRFFGVRKKGVTESHIAVIGGVGKYQGANGYATLKRVNNSQSGKEENEDSKLFKFSVYLSY